MILSDSHNDFLTSLKTLKTQEKYLKSNNNYIHILSCAIYTTDKIKTIKDLKKYINNYFKLQRTTNMNLILSYEDLSFVKDQETLQYLISTKPFSTTLTWNQKNQFCGGADTNLGLTKKGKLLINTLENNNILIDTAHMSRKAFNEFSLITKKPIYNSHCNINKLHSHKRNLTDKQIQKIINSNGFIGISIYEKFISNNKISSKDIAMQFDYIIKKFGENNIGLGSDFHGIDKADLPTNISDYKDLIYLENDLKDLGYTQTTIEKIFYKNFIEFINRNSYL